MADTHPFLGEVVEQQYQLQTLLARTSTRLLYRAVELSTNTTLYVHLVPLQSQAPENQKKIEDTFVRLARKVHAITHPNVLDLHDFGLFRGMGFLVYRPLEGQSLREYLRQHAPLPVSATVDFVEQIAEALSAGHEAGVIHGDLCPENILLVRSFDGSPLVHLLEFGVSQLLGCREEIEPSAAPSVTGRPQYMSPEKIQGTALREASDVYALATIAFEMLSGTVPFPLTSNTTEAMMEVLMRQASEPAPALLTFVPSLSRDVSDAVLRALAKSPEERPKTSQQFARLLARASVSLGETFSLPPEMSPQPTNFDPTPHAANRTPELSAPPPPPLAPPSGTDESEYANAIPPLAVREERDRKATVVLSNRTREQTLRPQELSASKPAPTQEVIRPASFSNQAPPPPTQSPKSVEQPPSSKPTPNDSLWDLADTATAEPRAQDRPQPAPTTLAGRMLDQFFTEPESPVEPENSVVSTDDASEFEEFTNDELFADFPESSKATIPLDKYQIPSSLEQAPDPIDYRSPEPYDFDDSSLNDLDISGPSPAKSAKPQKQKKTSGKIPNTKRKLLPLIVAPLAGGAMLAAVVAFWMMSKGENGTTKVTALESEMEHEESVPLAEITTEAEVKNPPQAETPATASEGPLATQEIPERPSDSEPDTNPGVNTQSEVPVPSNAVVANGTEVAAETDAPIVESVELTKIGVVDLGEILLASLAGKKVMDVYHKHYSSLVKDPAAGELKNQLRKQNRALVSELLVKIRTIIVAYGKQEGYAMIVNANGDIAKGPFIDESVSDPVGLFTETTTKTNLNQVILELFDKEFAGT